jgi:hypothetical protein
MIKHILFFCLASVMLFSASGCVTSTCEVISPLPGQLSSEGHHVKAMLRGMNTGVYLFYWIPLWSGKPERPNRREYDICMHKVDWTAMRRMFDAVGNGIESDAIEDFTFRESSSGKYGLWIFWKRVVHAEALAVTFKPYEQPDTPLTRIRDEEKRDLETAAE